MEFRKAVVLGWYTCVFFINDLPRVVRNLTLKMFADNVKVYRSVLNEHDVSLLQEDLANCCAEDLAMLCTICIDFLKITLKTHFA